MENFTCLVTGANSGLGKAMALELAKRGATIVMLCRDPKRGRKARIDLIAKSRNPNIDLMIADLSDPKSIYGFAQDFKYNYRELHLLANMAGVYYPRKKYTPQGYELNFATNVLGPFLLTNLLLDRMMESAPAQIINVSGESHRTGFLNFQDPSLNGHFTVYDANNQAALARIIWTYELARRLHGAQVTANTFCPGRVKTNLYRNLPLTFRTPVNLINRFFARSPAQAIAPVVAKLVDDETGPAPNGLYLVDGRPAQSVPITYDRTVGQQLMDLCEARTGNFCPVQAYEENVWTVNS